MSMQLPCSRPPLDSPLLRCYEQFQLFALSFEQAKVSAEVIHYFQGFRGTNLYWLQAYFNARKQLIFA
jgi:hypothetical protein